MTIDWDWFFSSLSQSSAALVGIFGAFIVAKVLSNQATFSEKSGKISQLLAGAEKLKSRIDGDEFEFYNDRKFIEARAHIQSFLLDSGLDPEAIYHRAYFSPYTDRKDALFEIRRLMKEFDRANDAAYEEEQEQRDQEQYEADMLNQQEQFGTFYEPLSGQASNQLQEAEGEAERRAFKRQKKAKKRINRWLREVTEYSSSVGNLFASTSKNPESSWQIAWSLFLLVTLFFIGVVLPLTYMPTGETSNGVTPIFSLVLASFFQSGPSIRVFLIVAISIIFLLIVASFIFLNSKLKYDINALEKLKKFSEIGSYSKYFFELEKNRVTEKSSH